MKNKIMRLAVLFVLLASMLFTGGHEAKAYTWTITNATKITQSGDNISMSALYGNEADSAANRGFAYTPIGNTAGDFSFEFTWIVDSNGNGGSLCAGLVGASAVGLAPEPYNPDTSAHGDAMWVEIYPYGNGFSLSAINSGNSSFTASSGSGSSTGVTYYIRMYRTGTTYGAKIYNNEARTSLVSDRSFTYTNKTLVFDYFQIGTVIHRTSGGTGYYQTARFGNLVQLSNETGYKPGLWYPPEVSNATATGFKVTAGVDSIGSANVTSWGIRVGTETGVYNSANYSSSGNQSTAFEFDNTFTLSSDTYYIVGWATNSNGETVSPELVYAYHSSPTVTTGGANVLDTNGATYTYTINGVLEDKGTTGNVSMGYTLGTTPTGVWKQQEESTNLIDWNSHTNPDGTQTWVVSGLLPNTQYFYRFYAYYVVDLYNIPYGYGSTANFTTGSGTGSAIVPDVGTVSAVWDSTLSELTFKGTVWFSTLPIVERGFDYGLGSLTDNVTSGTGNYGSGGTWELSVTGFVALDDVVYRAWAKDSAGNIGYGTTEHSQIPSAGLGAEITYVGTVVNGTTVLMKANITRVGVNDITLQGFAWGTTTNQSSASVWWQADAAWEVGQYTYEKEDLLPNTTYYVWAGLYDGNWLWTNATTFQTGNQGTATVRVPKVTTLSADTTVTTERFIANGRIVDLYGYVTTGMGFDVSLDENAWQQRLTYGTGNYSAGDYSMEITLPEHEGEIVYFRFWVTTEVGEGRGLQKAVMLGKTGVAGGAGVTVTPPSGGISGAIDRILKRWGMDNVMGHWAFIGAIWLLLLVGVAILSFFVEPIVTKIAAVLAGGVGLLALGAALFSGFLETAPLLWLAFIGAGLVIVLGGAVLRRGRIPSGGGE